MPSYGIWSRENPLDSFDETLAFISVCWSTGGEHSRKQVSKIVKRKVSSPAAAIPVEVKMIRVV